MHSICVWILVAFVLAQGAASPLPKGVIDNNVSKRTLGDPPDVQLPYNPFLPPFGVYPGVKPLKPIWPPGFFLNRFATPPTTPPTDPVAIFFKNKKEEFLNKLFDDLTMATESPDLQLRSALADTEEDSSEALLPPTPKPKIDPSVFINKKVDFLSQLFKTLNTTTPAPLPGDVIDPTATTVKPTIVPPGFWAPFPKTPKPPKATKPPKPEKATNLLLQAIDDALLRSVLDPSGPYQTPDLQLRSAIAEPDPDATEEPVTPKPKIDPSIFITKKFDFLSQLFKSLNTTTPAPLPGDVIDPTATTVKPTIVPPGFWVPFPKPPKPPKPTKPPKPEKTKNVLLNAIDEALLKSVLAQVDPSNPALAGPPKVARASFLDEFLHRVTEAPPTEAVPVEEDSLAARSIVPPGYWIPPYIYAAKMGIYLDKLFDTIDNAALTEDGTSKRSADVDPSALILDQMTALKNAMVAAYAEAKKSATSAPPTKVPPKGFKKPFWGPKTTPAPDTVQQHLDLLSDVYDKLAAVEQQLLTSQTTSAPPPAPSTVSYWAPDPAAADVGEYYKEKTQNFLAQIFSNKTSS